MHVHVYNNLHVSIFYMKNLYVQLSIVTESGFNVTISQVPRNNYCTHHEIVTVCLFLDSECLYYGVFIIHVCTTLLYLGGECTAALYTVLYRVRVYMYIFCILVMIEAGAENIMQQDFLQCVKVWKILLTL